MYATGGTLPDRTTILLSMAWYETRIHEGVLRYASEHNWRVATDHHMQYVPAALDAAGMITLCGDDKQRLKAAHAFKGPLVRLGLEGPVMDVPYVLPDNRAIGRVAADYLLGRGYRVFALLHLQNQWFETERAEGFREAAEAAGGTVRLFTWDREVPRGDDSLLIRRNWISDRLATISKPAAVFAFEDSFGSAVIDACRSTGVAIPDELAVISVNDDPLICPYAPVPLSSVAPDWTAMGYAAASLLGEMLRGKPIEHEMHRVAPLGVTERQSTDMLAVSDLRVARALRYIWSHYREPIGTADVARAVHVPIRTLQWAFRRHLGRGVQAEITRYRIDQVKRLLRGTNQTVSQIANDLGFSTPQYLFRLFRKQTGMTPCQYRRSKVS